MPGLFESYAYLYDGKPDIVPIRDRPGYYRVKYLCLGDETVKGAHLVEIEVRGVIPPTTDCPQHQKTAHLTSFYEGG